jgi:hypothetical protein
MTKQFERWLVIDLHPRHFGFVVVESPRTVLDWGVRRLRGKSNPADELVQKGLRRLLELWRPSSLVIGGPRKINPASTLAKGRLVKRVLAEADNHRLRARLLRTTAGTNERQTKYERALATIQHFPTLSHLLGPKRNVWESERYSASILEALAFCLETVRSRQRI